LAGLLWPHWPQRSALGNLRYALSNLRGAIGDRDACPPFLLITRETIQFNPAADYELDAAVLAGVVDAHRPALPELKRAVTLCRGSFLEGFSVGDSPAFDEWALLKREQFNRHLLEALRRLADHYEGKGEYEQAQVFAWRQVELEPWQEEGHQQLMRVLALSGRRSAALAQYRTCRRMLAQELGVEPARETTALYESIRAGEFGGATGPAIPAFLEEKEGADSQEIIRLTSGALARRVDPAERAHLHEAIGDALETLYGEHAGEIAAPLAWHFAAAGRTIKAVSYLLQAGNRAAQLAANQEALAHLRRGLELLQALPPLPECDRLELALQLALGAPLRATLGYGSSELGRVYARARELCRRVGETPELYTARLGLAGIFVTRAEYPAALELVEQLLATARQTQDPLELAIAYSVKGYCLLCLGELIQARALLEQGLAWYEPRPERSLFDVYGTDRGLALTWLSGVLFFLGYVDRARQLSREAIAQARDAQNHLRLAYALATAGSVFHDMWRDYRAVQEFSEELVQLGSETGPFQAYGMIHLGRMKARAGQFQEGLALIQQGLAAMRAMGHETNRSFFLVGLAEAYGWAGRVAEGLDALAEAFSFMDETGERYAEAEARRLKGELLLMGGDETGAEADFRKAVQVASRQQAKSFELRAAMSLCRLWHQQGKGEDARRMLAEIYGWFTEGLDTPDLLDAQAWVGRLA
jgi:DNA-binding SARP family transcriptional activator